MLKYLVFAALTAALPAHSADTKGFTAADLNTAARSAQAAPDLGDAREAVAQSETLRAAFVLSPAGGWKLLSPDEARALHMAFGGPRPLGDDAVQWFMRGASAGASASDTTGLYNPIADAWLVLRWQRIGGTLRIRDAVFLPGDALRDADDRTPWNRRAGAYADALAASEASARTSFASLDSDRFFAALGPLKLQASDEAFAQVTDRMASLKPWGSDKSRLAQWKSLHKRLAEGKAGGTVSALPPTIRASLVPMAALQRDGGGDSLLLISPLAPQMVVAADYSKGGQPDISLVNLANARTGDAQ